MGLSSESFISGRRDGTRTFSTWIIEKITGSSLIPLKINAASGKLINFVSIQSTSLHIVRSYLTLRNCGHVLIPKTQVSYLPMHAKLMSKFVL